MAVTLVFRLQLLRGEARDPRSGSPYWSAEGAKTPPYPLRSKVSHPPTRPLSVPLPPQSSTPAAPATLSSLQREQTIFPYESSHSLPDRFYILGSKFFLTRRPHPVFDALSPAPRSDPLFPGCNPMGALGTLSCANSSRAPSSTPAPGGVHLHPIPGVHSLFSQDTREAPFHHHLPSIIISLPSPSLRSIPSLRLSLRLPGLGAGCDTK